MTVYLSKHDGFAVLQVRAEGEGAIGDLAEEVRPGGSAFGKTYDEWAKLPDGPVVVDGGEAS